MQSIVKMQESKTTLTRNESCFVYQIFFCHLQYLDGIKDATIRLNTKSKTQDNKKHFHSAKGNKMKSKFKKAKTKTFQKVHLKVATKGSF